MNLWVLFLCRFFLHSKVKIKKVVFAAVLAAIGECLILLVPFGNSRIKSFLGFGSVTVGVLWFLFGSVRKETFYKVVITAYMSALVLGGSLEILHNLFQWEQMSVIGLSTAVVCLYLLLKFVYQSIRAGSRQEYVEVLLTFSAGNCCQILALVDSGNNLVEPISGQPVSLVEQRVMNEYMSALTPNTFRLVPFHSVGKSDGILEAYFIDKLEMKREGEQIVVERPLIGITKEAISANEKYQMILHPALLEN